MAFFFFFFFFFFDHILAAVMHKSFVTTAHPPTGKGGDCGISAFRPCYKPHTQGANWGFKTLLFGLTLEIENCPGVRILMHKKPRNSPCTADTLDK